MKFETSTYVCSICGKRHVKLWRIYGNDVLLICATCAEERQSPRRYEVTRWLKVRSDEFIGKPTGAKRRLPNWTVDENGLIPMAMGPGPTRKSAKPMTDQLVVDLSGVLSAYSSGRTDMIPACPTADGNFWGYHAIPKEIYEWWKSLPTR